MAAVSAEWKDSRACQVRRPVMPCEIAGSRQWPVNDHLRRNASKHPTHGGVPRLPPFPPTRQQCRNTDQIENAGMGIPPICGSTP